MSKLPNDADSSLVGSSDSPLSRYCCKCKHFKFSGWCQKHDNYVTSWLTCEDWEKADCVLDQPQVIRPQPDWTRPSSGNIKTDDGPKRMWTDVWICFVPCFPLHLTITHDVAIPFESSR